MRKQNTALQSLIINNLAIKKTLLLSSFQIAIALMQQKNPYTEAESVSKACLKIVAHLLHGGRYAEEKVQQTPLSEDTMTVQSAMIAEDIK